MRLLFNLILLSTFLISCTHAHKTNESKSTGRPVVFIHGSHFDAAVWDKVIGQMQSPVLALKAVDLPGRKEDEHATLTEMAQNTCQQLSKPAALVAHSFGGAVVSQMVGLCPEKIERIIYVTALVPLNREKSFDILGQAEQRAYEKAVNFAQSRIAPLAPKIFYRAMDADIDPKNLPKLKLYSESYGPGQDRLNYQEINFEKIPKFYIFASKDNIVSLKSQRRFAERALVQQTSTVESGHLPMISRPEELAKQISAFL